MKTTSLFISFLIILLTGCSSTDTENSDAENDSKDAKAKIEQDSINNLKKEKAALYTKQVNTADSLFQIQDFTNALESYKKALALTEDENNKKEITAKITESELKIEENRPMLEAENALLGKHTFGIQFIWDGYGSATITKEEGDLIIDGKQYSKDKKEYTLMKGTITIIDENKFEFNGNLKLFTDDCCGEIDKTGKLTFRKSGKRKFWRLQEFKSLCDPYTCAYYLDIFEK